MPQMPVRLWGIFEIRYWMLAAGIVTLDVLNLTGSNAGGHIAHLGGAIVTYFFIRACQGHEWNVYLFQVIDATRRLLFRPKSKKKRRGFSLAKAAVNYEEVNTKSPKKT